MTTPGESANLLEAHVRERLVDDGWVGRADPYHESDLDKNFRVHVFFNMATRSGFPISLTPTVALIHAPSNAHLCKLYNNPGWRRAWFMGYTFGQLEKLLPGDSGHPYAVSIYQGREREAAEGLAAFADHVGRPWLEQYANVDAAVTQILLWCNETCAISRCGGAAPA